MSSFKIDLVMTYEIACSDQQFDGSSQHRQERWVYYWALRVVTFANTFC